MSWIRRERPNGSVCAGSAAWEAMGDLRSRCAPFTLVLLSGSLRSDQHITQQSLSHISSRTNAQSGPSGSVIRRRSGISSVRMQHLLIL